MPSPPFRGGDTLACSQPLKAIRLFDDSESKYRIVFDSIAYDTGFYHGSYILERNRLLIPCGQCTSCRIQKSREWANRLMMELNYHEDAWFLTLTYNNDHARPAVDDNGEVCNWLTLCKRDFQLFMKRLRKQTGSKLRYFACGEYGTTTHRPHYHAIIFGLHLEDLKFYKKSELGFNYYTSEFLDSVWSETIDKFDPVEGKVVTVKEPIGYVVVGEVNWETCAYTARYVTKKLTGDASAAYDAFHVEPPFSLMSRNPGIAHQFYEDHRDTVFTQDYINLKTEKKGIKFAPPRYFKKLGLKDDNWSVVEDLAFKNAEMAAHAQEVKLSKTSYSLDEFLRIQGEAFEARIKKLVREIV